MSDRELKVNRGWVEAGPALRRLAEKGYAVSGYTDKGVPHYMLYRNKSGHKFELVHEFDTAEELNNMVKLLLDE